VVPVPRVVKELRIGVNFELNYLDPAANYAGPQYDDVIEFDEVSMMHAEAAPGYHYHYAATFEALNVMRAQYGSPPYPVEKYNNRDKYQVEHGIKPEPYDSAKKYTARAARRVTL
jgi:hypothetical protein